MTQDDYELSDPEFNDAELTFTVGEIKRVSELVSELAGWCYCDGIARAAGWNDGSLEGLLETVARLRSYGIKVRCNRLLKDAAE